MNSKRVHGEAGVPACATYSSWISGNFFILQVVVDGVRSNWKRWRSRRRRDGESAREEYLPLEKHDRLPKARVAHSLVQNSAISKDGDPDAGNLHVWICGSSG
jgi:hypothetical protein